MNAEEVLEQLFTPEEPVSDLQWEDKEYSDDERMEVNGDESTNEDKSEEVESGDNTNEDTDYDIEEGSNEES